MAGTLFSLPKAVPIDNGAAIPGAKLYFFQSGTTTPQNTYSDAALSTAHENPVEADSEGVFPPIYLDGALPSYRVRLTTQSDVQVYQVDGVPSSQKTVADDFTLTGDAPYFDIIETDASTNEGAYRIQVSGGSLYVYLANDALSAFTEAVKIERSGTTLSAVKVGGEDVTTEISDSFTLVMSTGYASAPTGTAKYTVNGEVVTLWVESAIQGTSNDDGMGFTNLPAAIWPSSGSRMIPTVVLDNGARIPAAMSISSGGVVTFYAGSPLASDGFTSSGTKGVLAGWSIQYSRS